MYVNDDTQKEKTIIPSLGGVEDVSVGRSSYFQLLELEDSILVEKGSSLVALVQIGSILDDSRFDP